MMYEDKYGGRNRVLQKQLQENGLAIPACVPKIGVLDGVSEVCFAISTERPIQHPALQAIPDSASRTTNRVLRKRAG